ncbi:MAG: tRNA lysidine(34) synthetase TilS [Ktedonobacteraceae bacterium]
MLATIATYIEQHHLLHENDTVVVAVSGGADSLCLLHILNRLCGPGKRYPQVQLHVAHLNHQLRGAESERDAAYVEQIANTWGLPITIAAVDVSTFARSEQLSLEEAARIARYRFLREVAQGQPIAVAHNADDQVETLLLHLLRGGGLASMVGMQPRRGDIIRPLLAVHRSAILAYCREQAIVPVEDSSNADTHFLRNRIRHELLPLLESMNPAIRATLLRNAEVVSVDMQYIEQHVDAIWSDVVVTGHEHSFTLSVPALLVLPLSLQRHLLRRLTAHLCAGQSPLEPRHYMLIEQFLQQANSGEERVLQLPAQLRLKRTLNTVCIYHQAEDTAPIFSASADEEMLPIPGRVALKGIPWLATTDIIHADMMQKVLPVLEREDWPEVWRFLPPDRHTVYIDGDTIDAVLAVRFRRPGDRIHPLGMAHEKKVQDILVDKHIARAERGTIPLFFSADCCIWLAGICIADSVRLTSTTRRIVRLSITPSAIIAQ